jgi:hypothetical protein
MEENDFGGNSDIRFKFCPPIALRILKREKVILSSSDRLLDRDSRDGGLLDIAILGLHCSINCYVL